jgi:hypothetical protein
MGRINMLPRSRLLKLEVFGGLGKGRATDVYYYDLEKPQDLLRLEPSFEAHWDRALKKKHKTETVPGKPGRMGVPCMELILH